MIDRQPSLPQTPLNCVKLSREHWRNPAPGYEGSISVTSGLRSHHSACGLHAENMLGEDEPPPRLQSLAIDPSLSLHGSRHLAGGSSSTSRFGSFFSSLASSLSGANCESTARAQKAEVIAKGAMAQKIEQYVVGKGR